MSCVVDCRKLAAVTLALAMGKEDSAERTALLEIASRWHELAEFLEEAEKRFPELWALPLAASGDSQQ